MVGDEWVVIGKGGSRVAATSKMECFVIIVNGFQPLTIITKHSILDVAAALNLPLMGAGGRWRNFWLPGAGRWRIYFE